MSWICSYVGASSQNVGTKLNAYSLTLREKQFLPFSKTLPNHCTGLDVETSRHFILDNNRFDDLNIWPNFSGCKIIVELNNINLLELIIGLMPFSPLVMFWLKKTLLEDAANSCPKGSSTPCNI